ncbi:MAG: GHKL domain-containing protein, partial [Hungatella sp.]
DLTVITPIRFCENETVNLLLSSFVDKMKKQDIILNIKVALPAELNIPDTELCSVLSNGLENALNATNKIEDNTLRKVFFDCNINRKMLLIEIENAYTGHIQMDGKIPTSTEIGHGYGCKSIHSIVKKRNGFCTFQAVDGVFTLRLVLPMDTQSYI